MHIDTTNTIPCNSIGPSPIVSSKYKTNLWMVMIFIKVHSCCLSGSSPTSRIYSSSCSLSSPIFDSGGGGFNFHFQIHIPLLSVLLIRRNCSLQPSQLSCLIQVLFLLLSSIKDSPFPPPSFNSFPFTLSLPGHLHRCISFHTQRTIWIKLAVRIFLCKFLRFTEYGNSVRKSRAQFKILGTVGFVWWKLRRV